MAVVCDFSVIRGNNPIQIGDVRPTWEEHFNSGGRHASTALLIFNVRGLANATASVPVRVNDTEVGRIYPYALPGGSPNADNDAHWFTQMVAFSGNILKGGDSPDANKLEVQAVAFPRVRRLQPLRRLRAQGRHLLLPPGCLASIVGGGRRT
jgi:hypothetical protein